MEGIILRSKLGIIGLLAVLVLCIAQTVSAADIWTDPTYTEIWTEPTETEIWTEPTETEVWTELTFTVKPIIDNGSTLVPIRGTLEQIGFSIEWRQSEKLVVVKRGETVVRLHANSKNATINGKSVTLQTPAKLVNGSVFVPLRFISQATGSEVGWHEASTKVTIDNQYFFYVDEAKRKNDPDQPKGEANANFFVGKWDIWVPGGWGNTGSTTNPDGSTTIEQEYVPGASGKTLTIHSNGTYKWEVVGETISGSWSDLGDGRILLASGQFEYDWYVEKVDQSQIKIYAWGMTEYGYRIN